VGVRMENQSPSANRFSGLGQADLLIGRRFANLPHILYSATLQPFVTANLPTPGRLPRMRKR
jgi:hypothetical protein